jgi:7-carboxy-7-deazaguanine synthase
MNNPDRPLPVVEIFGATLQGEGALAGYKTSFIRFGYCNYRCGWCDTTYAVDPKFKDEWEQLTPQQIVHRVLSHDTCWITITGGEPAIHDLSRVIGLLHSQVRLVNLETNGSIPRPWFASCDVTTLSPKAPSARKLGPDWAKLDLSVALSRRPVLKVVVDTLEDLHFARGVFARYPHVTERYLQVRTDRADTTDMILLRWRALADAVLSDARFINVALLPQLHVLLWGHRKGV